MLAWGLAHSRRAGRSSEEFFVAGRSLPWWLAGTSIVATTFAADTPLAIAGLIATDGIAGNWFWWADVLPAMLGAFLIAHLWRRSGVLTDPELVELRYGGRPAAALRVFRALYFGVVRNAIVIGWVNLAMAKVLQLALGLDDGASAWLLAGLFAVAVTYTLAAGLWGVVLTDVVQFALAMAGSIALAAVAVANAGGLAALIEPLRGTGTLDLIPSGREAFWAFVVYVGVQSWAAGNTEGNGYVAQRLLATRSERDARLAAVWYAIAHFALRPWPWILVGLVALVRYPALEDPEAGYVRVLLEDLPTGARGVMLAAMLAAFLSTIDTHLNWGASYLTNDLYRRWLRPGADERELVRAARVSVVLLAALGAVTTLQMTSIAGAWKFLAQISAGLGAVLLARWLWWRVNAWSEIAVMGTSLVASAVVLFWTDVPFPFSLALVAAVSLPVALGVTLLTPAESPERLARFYRRVRPAGWWGPVAAATGLPAERVGASGWGRVGAATAGVYAVLLGVGGLLLGRPVWGGLVVLGGGVLLGVAVRSSARASPPEPGDRGLDGVGGSG
jgi:SSS family transporter